jgi:hypothetical protein
VQQIWLSMHRKQAKYLLIDIFNFQLSIKNETKKQRIRRLAEFQAGARQRRNSTGKIFSRQGVTSENQRKTSNTQNKAHQKPSVTVVFWR